MKLALVDRRRRPGRAPWQPDGELLRLLDDLARPAGRPSWLASVVLVDDDEMARLNAGYRGEAVPTDVLSFSYLTGEGTGRPALAAGERHAFRDLWCDEPDPRPRDEATAAGGPDAADAGAGPDPVGDVPPWHAGEIVIAPAHVAERCAAHGWDPDAERALLVVHGLLHVLGWEHDTEVRRRAMRAEETELLARRGIAHPLRDEPAEDGWATT